MRILPAWVFAWRRVAAAVAFGALLCAAAPPGDSLPRRGVLGVSAVDRSGGVTIAAVIPALPGEAAGLRRDDVIASVDGAHVATVAEFLAKLRRPGGQPVSLGIVRGGSPMTVRVVLGETARETDPAVDTLYGAVDVDHSWRRTLVTVPHGATGKHPAVLVVGGIGCFSVDVASNAQDAYMRLTHDLSRRGFVTMRLEKSGVGDSQGPPCRSVDFLAESASYGVAFDALRNDSAVDPAHVYVVGHSIGSLIGPRLALQKPVAGLVVAEGVGVDWIEYELLNSRRQEALGGATPAEVDSALLLKELCMHRLLVEKQPRETLLRDQPACKDYIAYPTGDDYFRELVTLNVAEPWTKLSIPVLAVYGTADFVTDEADHRRIVDIVNGVHPGAATLDVIPGMDHNLVNAGSPKASLERSAKGGPAPYDERFSTAVATWLCERERCAPAPRNS
jgi:pimeloyl-ACP methyl ester carboxylesterase